MKCPHCEYEHDPSGTWNDAEQDYAHGVIGDCGGFYHLPIVLERIDEGYYQSRQTKHLYACPSCMKTFVE
jgi:hypothetical protein